MCLLALGVVIGGFVVIVGLTLLFMYLFAKSSSI